MLSIAEENCNDRSISVGLSLAVTTFALHIIILIQRYYRTIDQCNCFKQIGLYFNNFIYSFNFQIAQKKTDSNKVDIAKINLVVT